MIMDAVFYVLGFMLCKLRFRVFDFLVMVLGFNVKGIVLCVLVFRV